MFELFRKYGVSPGQTRDLLALLESPTGKYITTASHRILRDRNRLIITDRKSEQEAGYSFASLDEMSLSGLYSDITVINKGNDPLPSGSLTACLDLDLLRFPLTVRRWKPGDRFSPLGMTGMKKISDLLTDLKVPVTIQGEGNGFTFRKRCCMGHGLPDRQPVQSHTGNREDFDDHDVVRGGI